MTKRLVCTGMVVCILLSLCSCKKAPNNVANEAPEEDISFISVMLGDKNIEEWNENNVTLNVSWDKLKLSEDDEKKFQKGWATEEQKRIAMFRRIAQSRKGQHQRD